MSLWQLTTDTTSYNRAARIYVHIFIYQSKCIRIIHVICGVFGKTHLQAPRNCPEGCNNNWLIETLMYNGLLKVFDDVIITAHWKGWVVIISKLTYTRRGPIHMCSIQIYPSLIYDVYYLYTHTHIQVYIYIPMYLNITRLASRPARHIIIL